MVKLLGSIAVLAGLVAGCGSDESPSAATTPTPTATPTVSAHAETEQGFEDGHAQAVRDYYGGEAAAHTEDGDVEAEYHQPPRPASGGIGDTITLTGSNIGVRMRVTLTGLGDPVSASRPPRAGTRYVGVNLRLKNTGIAIMEGELANALLDYGPGQGAKPVLGVEAGCSNGLQAGLRIEDGPPLRGCMLFEVPTGKRPQQLLLALENVPAEAGGRWRLR